jgi:hypothetical protein
MESIDIRLQRRVNVSLYALIFLTGLLGFSVLMEGCEVKHHVKVNLGDNKNDIALLVLDRVK